MSKSSGKVAPKRATKRANAPATANFLGYRLVQVLLLRSSLERTVPPEGGADEDAETFVYNAHIERIQPSDRHTFAFVTFKAGKERGGAFPAQIQASYMFGFFGDPLQEKQQLLGALRHLVESMAWPKFRDLFDQTCSQAELDYPRLPLRPNEITVVEPLPLRILTKTEAEDEPL